MILPKIILPIMILPKNNHHPSPVPTGSHLAASFMRWSKVELPSGKNHTTWNMNNFEYSKSRQLSQSNYEFQAKLVPWKPISFLQIWYFASFGPIETTKTVHLSPHIHSYLRARKEKVKREEVDRRVKESREEYSERFSPESQWVVVEEVIVVVSVFLSFCLSQSSSEISSNSKCYSMNFQLKSWVWMICEYSIAFVKFGSHSKVHKEKRMHAQKTRKLQKHFLSIKARSWMDVQVALAPGVLYYACTYNTVIFGFVRTHKVFLE